MYANREEADEKEKRFWLNAVAVNFDFILFFSPRRSASISFRAAAAV